MFDQEPNSLQAALAGEGAVLSSSLPVEDLPELG
jgi:hypothetical protein